MLQIIKALVLQTIDWFQYKSIKKKIVPSFYFNASLIRETESVHLEETQVSGLA